MSRPKKRLPKPQSPKGARVPAVPPTVNLGEKDHVVERRRFLLQLIRRGISQPDQIVEMYKQKDYDVSERTIRDDRMAVREMLKAAYSDDAAATRNELSAQLDDLAVQFQDIAQKAMTSEKRSYYAAVQALGQKKDTIVSKGKLIGVFVEKTEHSGTMTQFNLNADAQPADFAAIKQALNKAKIDADGNPTPSPHSDEEA
jgi:hypothetical protein